MPGISPWTIFILFGIVSAWATKALEDGKITLTEAAMLAEDLGPVLGIPVEIEIPSPDLAAIKTVELHETLDEAPENVEEEPGSDIPPQI